MGKKNKRQESPGRDQWEIAAAAYLKGRHSTTFGRSRSIWNSEGRAEVAADLAEMIVAIEEHLPSRHGDPS